MTDRAREKCDDLVMKFREAAQGYDLDVTIQAASEIVFNGLAYRSDSFPDLIDSMNAVIKTWLATIEESRDKVEKLIAQRDTMQ